MKRTVPAILLILITAAVAGSPRVMAQSAAKPVYLIVRYRAATMRGPQFRRELMTRGRERFEMWKSEGRFRSYRILASSTFTETSWDAILIVTFDRFSDVQGWLRIEQEYPGGLDSAALALGRPVASDLWDLPFSGGAIDRTESTGGESVFLVKPYGYQDRSLYMLYAAVYVARQFDAWLGGGTIRSYGVYLNREPTGPAWDILMVLEYHNMNALADRDAVKKGAGAALQRGDAWDLLNRMKLSIRGSDEERLVARQIAP